MDSSPSLPTGVVTFLLTDIEGSTRLWEREPDTMRQALARHDAIVNACVQRQHGHVVKSKGEGDSVFAVFERVRDAVTAALVLQCALAVERWPTSTRCACGWQSIPARSKSTKATTTASRSIAALGSERWPPVARCCCQA